MTMKKVSVKGTRTASQSCLNDSVASQDRAGRQYCCHERSQHQQQTSSTSSQGLQASDHIGLPRAGRQYCFHERSQHQQQTSSTSSQGLQASDHTGLPRAHVRNEHQASILQSSNILIAEVSQEKKEKMGLFHNLRRRFSSLSLKKSESEELSGYIRQCHSTDITPNMSNSRLKGRNKVPRDAESRSLSSHSCCNSPVKPNMSPKLSEWHSNTERCNLEVSKSKPACLSKDISRFNPVSPHRCDTYEDSIFDSIEVTINANKVEDKHHHSDLVCDLADCVEYDPVKEQTKIWSPKVWSLTQELFRLSKFGWYWGPITRNEAEDKLTNQPDGAFLVRDSSDERYLLSLSFRSYGRTLHTRIEHCNGMFSFYAQPDTEGYPSIVDLIEHSMNDSQTGIFYYSRSRSPGAPQFPVRLTKPVSRYMQVRSLQYLCRFVIRQHTRYDHIQQLPLPTTLKGWIEENQY